MGKGTDIKQGVIINCLCGTQIHKNYFSKKAVCSHCGRKFIRRYDAELQSYEFIVEVPDDRG